MVCEKIDTPDNVSDPTCNVRQKSYVKSDMYARQKSKNNIKVAR